MVLGPEVLSCRRAKPLTRRDGGRGGRSSNPKWGVGPKLDRASLLKPGGAKMLA